MAAGPRMTRTPRLLERDSELEALAGAAATAASGDGTLVVIAGTAGTGKTSLLAAAVERARELGLAVRRGRGSELERELSFGVVRQLFEPWLRAAPAAERERMLSGAAAAAARLFADRPLDRSSAADGRFATLQGLYWLAAAGAADRPALLVVDDVQWADAPSLRALSYLAGRIADVPIALVVALRSHETGAAAGLLAELESQPVARRLELSALRPAAVAVLVREAIPGAGDELCAAFGSSSAGNPFYLCELLRSVAAQDGATPTPGAVREAAVTSVGDRVLRRIAALGPHAPGLAAAMAVLGFGGRLRDAAAVAGQPEEEAAEAARAMRRVEILAVDDPFEWEHPLVRSSILDDLDVARLDALHARAAEVLAGVGEPPGAVAAHLSALRPAGSARVVAGLLAAADEALGRDAPEVAVSLLRRALEEEAGDPPRAALLLRLGQVEVMGRDPGAMDVLREVLELSRDPRERALAAISLGESLTHAARWDASAAVIGEAIEEYDGSDPELALELEMVRAVHAAFDPSLAAGVWGGRERLRELCRGGSWAARALSALLALEYAFRGEQLGDVVALCDHAVADGVLLAERGAGAWVPAHVLGALAAIERYDLADAFADELERAARAQGSLANAFAAEGYRGYAAARRGDLAAAEEILRPLVDATRANGMVLALVTALWWMADVILERPSQDDLVGLIESLELPQPFMEAAGGAWVTLTRGRVRALRGLRAEAEADLRTAGGILGRLGFGPLHDPWRSTLALTLAAEDAGEARTLVAEELALAGAAGSARARGVALRAAGLVGGGDEGVEALRESVAELAGSPARHEHARSLVALGAALRRSGRRGDSREPLEAGMELAHRCAAPRLVSHAREELVAAGARPRRAARSGMDGLTASERRIVRLAAEGRSNPEIGQVLFVSVKTVETHLSSAYRKLNLSGPGARRRLAPLLARSVPAGESGAG